MAWTAPMTATANTAFTAAQFNSSVRDNLLETAVAKATSAGKLIVTTGANSLAERSILNHIVNTSETTGSTSYVDLATVGPTVSITTGTRAVVWWCAQMNNTITNAQQRSAIDISGATTSAPSDSIDLFIDGLPGGQAIRSSAVHLYTGLTAGTNVFKMQYKVGSGTGTFFDRELVVMAL